MADEEHQVEVETAREHPAPAERGWSSWSLERKLSVVIIPIVVALIGLTPAMISGLSGDDPQSQPTPTPQGTTAPPQKANVPRFDGVVLNFELSRSFISFLEDNDGEAVLLEEVGFPDAAFYLDETSGDPAQAPVYVQVFTECDPPIAQDVQPDFSKGCTATSFEIDGPMTEDAQTYWQHGVPMYDGFFRVDVSGNLQNGVSPIYLEPLTREEATTG